MQATIESSHPISYEAEGFSSPRAEFAELRALMKTSDPVRRRTDFPWFTIAILAAIAVVIFAGMMLWRTNVVAQALNGVLLGFVLMQLGFLMHDCGHGQIFRSPSGNRKMGLICANLMLGVSYGWWVDKHSRHHKSPNQIDVDPDIDFAALAFCEKQAASKNWPWRWIVKYQAFFFVPFLLGEHVNLNVLSIGYLLQKGVKHRMTEGLLLACHHILSFAIAFGLLGIQPAIAFLVCSKAFAGLYAGLVFAPNHKGMLTVDEQSSLSLLRRQILTSRNIRSGLVIDFLYGGLNYQIEHHLFPFLQRNQLAAAQRIIKPFCRERGIRYHETGVFQSLKEIFHHLHQVGASLQSRQSPDDLGPLEYNHAEHE